MELYPLVDAFVLHVCVHMLACVNLVSDLSLSLSIVLDCRCVLRLCSMSATKLRT